MIATNAAPTQVGDRLDFLEPFVAILSSRLEIGRQEREDAEYCCSRDCGFEKVCLAQHDQLRHLQEYPYELQQRQCAAKQQTCAKGDYKQPAQSGENFVFHISLSREVACQVR